MVKYRNQPELHLAHQKACSSSLLFRQWIFSSISDAKGTIMRRETKLSPKTFLLSPPRLSKLNFHSNNYVTVSHLTIEHNQKQKNSRQFLQQIFVSPVLQPFVAWTVDRMVSASRANVAVIRAMWAAYAINCRATPDAPSMASARMAHAFARKDGTDVTVHCVSIVVSQTINWLDNIWCAIQIRSCRMAARKEQRNAQTEARRKVFTLRRLLLLQLTFY